MSIFAGLGGVGELGTEKNASPGNLLDASTAEQDFCRQWPVEGIVRANINGFAITLAPTFSRTWATFYSYAFNFYSFY